MAEHQIETRILLRYDTYSNWMQSTVILKEGEAAIAIIPRVYNLTGTDHHPDNTPPAVGIKIGDNYHHFDELPWVQGVAADVYSWAKQSSKPIYTANEIQGLAEFINNQTGGSGGGEPGGVVTKEYQLVRGINDDINKYYLQSRAGVNDNWVIDTTHYIDLSDLNNIVSWIGDAIEDYWTLSGFVSDKINTKINTLDYNDSNDYEQVVVAVSQENGLINVEKTSINMDMLNGVLSVRNGGTGLSRLEPNEVLIGNGINAIRTRAIDNIITEDSNNLVTTHAIINYVTAATAGLTGAMHYIGEATVDMSNSNNKSINPQINGYNFSQAKPGDVVIFEAKEYVWDGAYWRLLGDEGSYAVKGAITDVDIAEGANININKIYQLNDILENKVNIIEGKTLTTNDFTNEDKQKLEGIEDNAQRNLIEHIYINGTEATPTTIDNKPNSLSIRLSSLTPEEEEKLRGIETGAQVNAIEHIFLNETEIPIGTTKQLPKSVNISLTEYTEAEKQKLFGIATGAQVNTIESISINGTAQTPDENKNISIIIPDHSDHINKIEEIQLNGVKINPNQDKQINIVIDENAVSFRVLAGAQIPTGVAAAPYEDVAIDDNTKKLQLARIAATGRIYDIQNTTAADAADYLILNCGDAKTLID